MARKPTRKTSKTGASPSRKKSSNASSGKAKPAGKKAPAGNRAAKAKTSAAERKSASTSSRVRSGASAKKTTSSRPAKSAGKKTAKKTSVKKAPANKPAGKKATTKTASASRSAATLAKTAAKPPAARGRARGKKGSAAEKAALLLAHTHDDLYAARLIEELEFRHGIDVSTLDIGIRDGKARARGVVSDEDELDAVRDTIAEGGGISALEYLVQIAPNRREEDRDRAQQVQEVLDAEPDLQAENLQVACVNGKVILRGTVSNLLSKGKAGLLALRQDGVQRIRNRLVIVQE